MNVLLFGATGMVGQGVLRECLLDPAVERVVVVGRSETGRRHRKLVERVQPNVAELSGIEEISNIEACFFCLGVSSAGMSEEQYAEITYDLTMQVAEELVRQNAGITFIYVSGVGTDSSERGRVMWARVKGRTENALLEVPFERAFMFRPGVIIPLHGATSKTRWTRILYRATKPLHGLLTSWFPDHVTTTEAVGRGMLAVAREGYERPILEPKDINAAAATV